MRQTRIPMHGKTANRRTASSRAALVAALGLSVLATSQAHAQTVPSAEPGWRFSLAPYAWVPALSAQLRYNLPGPASRASVEVDSISVIEALNFAAFVAGEARNGPFTISTDFIYLDLGNSGSAVRSVDFFQFGRNPVSSSVNAGTESSVSGWLGTLTGGYTLAQGSWGHVDAQAGVRVLSLSASTQVRLGADIIGPGPGLTFSREARLSRSETLTDGIVGVRGRFVLGSGFHVPYAFDIGAGSSKLTWQASAGIGYQAGQFGVSAGWRHLAYEQGGSALVEEITLSGPYIALNFTF